MPSKSMHVHPRCQRPSGAEDEFDNDVQVQRRILALQQSALLSGGGVAAAALRGAAGNFGGIVAARLQMKDDETEKIATLQRRANEIAKV